jgi:hypothetical protein
MMHGYLAPGEYAVELGGFASRHITALLESLGFSEIALDPLATSVLAVARLEEPIAVPLLAWQMIRRLESSPRAPLTTKVASPLPTELYPGRVYEVRLLTDDRDYPPSDRAKLFGALLEARTLSERLIAVKRGVHLPGSFSGSRMTATAWLTWLEPLETVQVSKLPGLVDQIHPIA